ncbi:MAG TPA: hypothetical protein VFQ44_06155 [Streptosporangiaceae bacterium]|nr:hypothetical protein [Streptosporangiaceae bacterium]
MVRRQMTRLAVAAAAAGTVCALGASAAYAAPSSSWAGPSGAVPGAITNSTPSLSSVSFPGSIGSGIIVAWRTRGNVGHIKFRFKTATFNKGHWSKVGEVPGTSAITTNPPVIRSYTDPFGHSAVVVFWSGHLDHHIWWEQGETKSDGSISWTKAAVLPKKVQFDNTTSGPTALFTNKAFLVLLAWRGPANHDRYATGQPSGRGFKWSNSHIIPGPPVTSNCKNAPCTGNTPALAEQQTSTSSGKIYYFWRQSSTKAVKYATTADTFANLTNGKTSWTAPVQVPGAATILAPAASDSTTAGFGPLLLAYKAVSNTNVRFQTFDNGTWSAAARIPTTHTTVAPDLWVNRLATTTPGTDGNIVLHTFTP